MEAYDVTIQFRARITASSKEAAEYIANQSIPKRINIDLQTQMGHGRVDRVSDGMIKIMRKVKES